MQYAIEGCNYGDLKLIGEDKSLLQMSSVTSGLPVFDFPLTNVSLCVVPATNRDEVEIQFLDSKGVGDSIVQMTLHFPSGEEDEEGLSSAESLHREIVSTGLLRSVTGSIVAEFSKEQGNFVTPRGKYAIQMMGSYLHMQGPQYSYKIPYDDIQSLFLLDKPDGVRMAFVIALNKPIRQGNQKYQNLVLETNKSEHTIRINLSDEEIKEKYDGQLATEITLPMSSLIAKIFKVLSDKKVFVPKQYKSSRDTFSIKCSIKANEGLLYPLAKSFIFIHKPTVIISFDDIDYIEFKRYEPVANSATRNFDLSIYMKSSISREEGKDKDYTFLSIDRSEYSSLFDYLSVKEIKIKNPQVAYGPGAGKVGGLLDVLGDEEEDDESEEDDDYEGGESSGSGGDEDSEDEVEVEEDVKKKKKVNNSKGPDRKKGKKE